MKTSGIRLTQGALVAMMLILAGFGLLFLRLGAEPLSNAEAAAALHAFKADAYSAATLAAAPAYSTPTSMLFGLFGANEASARVVPALATIGLLLLPVLFQKRLGWSRTVLLQLGVFLSPVLLTTGRTAGGWSLAALTAIIWISLVLCGEDDERWTLAAAGVFGILMITGSVFYQGIFAAVITLLLLFVSGDRDLVKRFNRPARRLFPHIGFSLLVIFMVSSYAGLHLDRLRDIFAGLDMWLEGWRGGETGILRAFTLIPIYEPLLLVGGAAGAAIAFRRHKRGDLYVVAAAAGGWLAFLLYPGRQSLDLIWVSLPLLWLTVSFILDWFHIFETETPWMEYFLIAGSMLTLFVFAFFQFQSYQSGRGFVMDNTLSSEQMLLGAILVAVLTVVMVLFYWRRARDRSWLETIIIAGVLLFVVAFAYLQFSAFANSAGGSQGMDAGLRLRFWSGVGALILVAILAVLTGLGWSWGLAEKTAGTALLLVLCALNLSNTARLNYPGEGAPLVEAFHPSATAPGMALLERTLAAASVRETGRTDLLDVVTFGEQPAALAWSLRTFTTHQNQPPPVPPALLFPSERSTPSLQGDYVGQSLTLFYRLSGDADWTEALFNSRTVLPESIQWQLLVRRDLATVGEPAANADAVLE